jgi:hypothetical protein
VRPATPRTPAARISRKGLLAVAGASLVAACGGGDDKERERQARTAADLEIVRFLLGVERITTAFWEAVVQRGALGDMQVAPIARQTARNDRTHVETLERYERRLGTPSTPPETPGFGEIFAAGPREVLESGAELANLAAAAYLGQANRIQDRNLLASVLAIHSVEGRQAAAINRIGRVGDGVLPDDAFAQPLTMAQVRSRMKRFGA